MGTTVKDNVIEIPGGRVISEAVVGEPYFDDSGVELVEVICTLHRPKRLVFLETDGVELESGLYTRSGSDSPLTPVGDEAALSAAKEVKNSSFFVLVEVG